MARVDKLEHNMAKIYMEVTPAEFEAACTSAYKKQKNQFTVPGFRKGKATRSMIEKMYGKGVFYEEAINSILPDLYEKTYKELKEEGMIISSRPQIDIETIEAGKNVVITAECALKPEVALGEYKGVAVEKETVAVTEDDIEAELKKDAEKNGRLVDITDRPAEMGDTVKIDFEGKVDGTPFEGGSAKDSTLILGSHSFVDTFEDQVAGKSIGDEFDVNVTFPENYKEDLAGKAAVFSVKLNSIQKKEIPALDDDYAKDYSEFETLAELKEDMGKKLLERKQKEADSKRADAILVKVMDNASVDIPAVMVDERVNENLESTARNLSQYGLKMDQYLEMMGTNAVAYKKQMQPAAEKAIKQELVLGAIAKAEAIEASDEEVMEEYKKMAEAYGMTAEQLDSMPVSDDDKEMIADNLKLRKANDFIVANAVEA